MRGELVLTIDNLGEASALERGSWDGRTPLGRHPSVTVALPRLLAALGAHALRATFCVEAINCELNPAAVRAINAAGHELAVHGWRHEAWDALAAGREPELLERSRSAYGELGLAPAGFRPPGGRLGPRTLARLRAHGFTWCSPQLGTTPEADGPVLVPFSWELVDAYHLMGSFADLREDRGDGSDALTPVQTAQRIRAELQAGAPADPRVLVLHPFLLLDRAWWSEVERLLADIAAAVAAGQLRCITAGEAAASGAPQA